MEHIQSAWGVVSENLVGWIIYSVVFGLVVGFTCGLGAILAVNHYRGIAAAVAENRAPEIGDLFNFDNIGEDVMWLVVMAVAIFIGELACGIGAVVAVVLLNWSIFIVAEGKMSAMDSFKGSFEHAKENWTEILIFVLICGALNFVGVLCCYVGIFVTAPVVACANWLFFSANKEAIYAKASEAGLAVS